MAKNKGTGTVIISTPDATATYTASSVTVTPKTHSNVTVGSNGSGLTYTSGTGVTGATWSAPGNYKNVGTVSAADFLIDGEISLREVLEQRLNMLVPNPEMEREWNELKQLGDAYRKLEAECKEKSKVWKALKKV